MDEQLYLCPNCFVAGGEPGNCPNCGTLRVGCRPGDPDDPCRRPLIDSRGMVRTRAPLWWLRYTVTQLTDYIQDD